MSLSRCAAARRSSSNPAPLWQVSLAVLASYPFTASRSRARRSRPAWPGVKTLPHFAAPRDRTRRGSPGISGPGDPPEARGVSVAKWPDDHFQAGPAPGGALPLSRRPIADMAEPHSSSRDPLWRAVPRGSSARWMSEGSVYRTGHGIQQVGLALATAPARSRAGRRSAAQEPALSPPASQNLRIRRTGLTFTSMERDSRVCPVRG